MDILKPSLMFKEPTIQRLKELCGEARTDMSSSVIIAGGAVRDVLCGRPVKDIDIFYRLKTPYCLGLRDWGPDLGSQTTEKQLKEAEKLFELDCKHFAKMMGLFETDYGYKIEFPEPGETDSGVAIKDLCKLQTTCIPFPIEIICIEEDPVDDVHNYDFSISQCFVTPHEMFMTDACNEDMRRSIIRYMPTNANTNDAALQRSKRRLARLRAKYPDWTYAPSCKILDNLKATDEN